MESKKYVILKIWRNATFLKIFCNFSQDKFFVLNIQDSDQWFKLWIISWVNDKNKISLGILLKLVNMQQFIFLLNALQSIWVYQQQAVEHRMVFPKDIFGPFDVLQVSWLHQNHPICDSLQQRRICIALFRPWWSMYHHCWAKYQIFRCL